MLGSPPRLAPGSIFLNSCQVSYSVPVGLCHGKRIGDVPDRSSPTYLVSSSPYNFHSSGSSEVKGLASLQLGVFPSSWILVTLFQMPFFQPRHFWEGEATIACCALAETSGTGFTQKALWSPPSYSISQFSWMISNLISQLGFDHGCNWSKCPHWPPILSSSGSCRTAPTLPPSQSHLRYSPLLFILSLPLSCLFSRQLYSSLKVFIVCTASEQIK